MYHIYSNSNMSRGPSNRKDNWTMRSDTCLRCWKEGRLKWWQVSRQLPDEHCIFYLWHKCNVFKSLDVVICMMPVIIDNTAILIRGIHNDSISCTSVNYVLTTHLKASQTLTLICSLKLKTVGQFNTEIFDNSDLGQRLAWNNRVIGYKFLFVSERHYSAFHSVEFNVPCLTPNTYTVQVLLRQMPIRHRRYFFK